MAAQASKYTLKINPGDYTYVNTMIASNTANTGYTVMPMVGWGGAGSGITDPLNQMPPTPRPETPEQWLRRRVRETQWKPV